MTYTYKQFITLNNIQKQNFEIFNDLLILIRIN